MDDDLQALAGGDGVSIHTGFPNSASTSADAAHHSRSI